MHIAPLLCILSVVRATKTAARYIERRRHHKNATAKHCSGLIGVIRDARMQGGRVAVAKEAKEKM